MTQGILGRFFDWTLDLFGLGADAARARAEQERFERRRREISVRLHEEQKKRSEKRIKIEAEMERAEERFQEELKRINSEQVGELRERGIDLLRKKNAVLVDQKYSNYEILEPKKRQLEIEYGLTLDKIEAERERAAERFEEEIERISSEHVRELQDKNEDVLRKKNAMIDRFKKDPNWRSELERKLEIRQFTIEYDRIADEINAEKNRAAERFQGGVKRARAKQVKELDDIALDIARKRQALLDRFKKEPNMRSELEPELLQLDFESKRIYDEMYAKVREPEGPAKEERKERDRKEGTEFYRKFLEQAVKSRKAQRTMDEIMAKYN